MKKKEKKIKLKKIKQTFITCTICPIYFDAESTQKYMFVTTPQASSLTIKLETWFGRSPALTSLTVFRSSIFCYNYSFNSKKKKNDLNFIL